MTSRAIRITARTAIPSQPFPVSCSSLLATNSPTMFAFQFSSLFPLLFAEFSINQTVCTIFKQDSKLFPPRRCTHLQQCVLYYQNITVSHSGATQHCGTVFGFRQVIVIPRLSNYRSEFEFSITVWHCNHQQTPSGTAVTSYHCLALQLPAITVWHCNHQLSPSGTAITACRHAFPLC